MQDNNNSELKPESDEVNLSLPIKKKDLGKFISGLLGQHQSIEREMDIKFDINHAWVINLHEMISQRIHQQTEADLSNFISVIYLQDGLKRTFTSVDALKTYVETKKQIPVGIKIIWNYLIQFPAKNHPEKQQITFSAHIYSDKKGSRDKAVMWLIDTIRGDSETSSLNYQIDHTERTWGDDIETIISNQVYEVRRGNQTIDAFFNLSRLVLALVIVLACLFYPLYTSIENTYQILHEADQMRNEEMSNYLKLLADAKLNNDLINLKLDHISRMVNIPPNFRETGHGMWGFVLMMASGPLMIAFLRFTRKNTHSFLTFSKESEKYRKLKLKQEKLSTLVLVGSFIVSVVAGVIGNYIFTFMGN